MSGVTRTMAAFSLVALLATGGLLATARALEKAAVWHEETGRPATPVYRSPQSLCISPDGSTACVANATANTVSVIDVRGRKVVAEIPVGARPCSVAFSPDGRSLYVSCAWAGRVDVVDLAAGRVTGSFPAGDEPNGVTPSRDGRRLYVANAISEDVSIVDLETGRAVQAPVGVQPRYLAETPDGLRVLVANSLSRSVSILDARTGRELERRDLGRCSMLRQIQCSRDGRWAFLANLVSHDEAPTVQIERGWIHSNGFSVLDLAHPGHRVTLLLDHLLRGAANPTGLVLSADNRRLYVTLAGVHEVAIVDVPAVLRLVEEAVAPEQVRRLQENVEILEKLQVAQRFAAGGLGPRSLAISDATGELFIANYFSDSVSVMDAQTGAIRAVIPLGPPQEMSLWRQGELMACDARMCYQNWFSCASCHQEDATVDGLNWDLANDGLGNPKNAKELINSHDTPPAMWGGVREDLDDGVAGGQRFEGFIASALRQKALVEYLEHPDRAPNPHRLRNPEVTARGQLLFAAAGCGICHPAPKYTDQKLHDLGFGTADDYRSRFDTPSLRSCYRTAPYLHDGRALTLRAIFTEFNPNDVHGRTKGFTDRELDDLVAYLRTL